MYYILRSQPKIDLFIFNDLWDFELWQRGQSFDNGEWYVGHHIGPFWIRFFDGVLPNNEGVLSPC